MDSISKGPGVRQPQPCPRGWRLGPPDFVGLGVQRSGTSWWYLQITAHPQVCFDRDVHFKEVHFFNGFRDREFRDSYIERYYEFFPRPPGNLLVGEWTPRYMYDPWTPRLLARAAPQAKTIILLRDPVERYRSGIEWEASREGRAPFDEDIVQDHLARGLYAGQVRRVFEHISRERVLILQFEHLRDQPEEQIRRTYQYLGVEEVDFLPAEILRYPRRGKSRYTLPDQLADQLAELYASDVRELLRLVPELDVDLWPRVRRLL